MFFKLFQKECAQMWKSLIYWIFIACVGIFFFSQMGNPDFDGTAPVKGREETYGEVYSKDKQIIMENTLGELAQSYYHDNWTTYPIGFSKHVTLNEQELAELDEILVRTTGLSEEARGNEIEKYYKQSSSGTEQGYQTIYFGSFSMKPQESLTYEAFQKEMKKVCKILGPGSSYEEKNYGSGTYVKATYEEAKADYDNFIKKDKITGGYARLFCDYMGIVLGLMPVFVAVTRCMRDKRSQMKDLIYVRKASSWCIVASRYAAMVVMMLLPVLLASCMTLFQCAAYGAGKGISIGYLTFFPYVFGWLLPEIMVVSALGMCLTELTDTAAAVLVQGIWWFADIFGSADQLSSGQYGMHLVPRHNSVRGYEVFREHFQQLVTNRVFYAVLSLILVIATILIYEAKRKGKWDFYGKIHSRGKRKLEA